PHPPLPAWRSGPRQVIERVRASRRRPPRGPAAARLGAFRATVLGEGGGEPPQRLADAALDRPLRLAEMASDFRVAEPVQIGERDRLAFLIRELAQGPPDAARHRAGPNLFLDARSRGLWRLVSPAGARPLGSHHVDGTPRGDGRETGPRRAELRSVLLRCIPQGGEGLLDDVRGESVVTEHAPCHRSDGDVVEMEDLLEGAFVAIADP